MLLWQKDVFTEAAKGYLASKLGNWDFSAMVFFEL